MLPVIAKMVDVGIEGAREMYAKLSSQARSRPHVLDDHTVEGVERSMREELDDIGTYEWQLGPLGRRHQLTSEQASEIERLRERARPWRAVVQMTLELCAELRKGTIDAIMRNDDAELGLEALLGLTTTAVVLVASARGRCRDVERSSNPRLIDAAIRQRPAQGRGSDTTAPNSASERPITTVTL